MISWKTWNNTLTKGVHHAKGHLDNKVKGKCFHRVIFIQYLVVCSFLSYNSWNHSESDPNNIVCQYCYNRSSLDSSREIGIIFMTVFLWFLLQL